MVNTNRLLGLDSDSDEGLVTSFDSAEDKGPKNNLAPPKATRKEAHNYLLNDSDSDQNDQYTDGSKVKTTADKILRKSRADKVDDDGEYKDDFPQSRSSRKSPTPMRKPKHIPASKSREDSITSNTISRKQSSRFIPDSSSEDDLIIPSRDLPANRSSSAASTKPVNKSSSPRPGPFNDSSGDETNGHNIRTRQAAGKTPPRLFKRERLFSPRSDTSRDITLSAPTLAIPAPMSVPELLPLSQPLDLLDDSLLDLSQTRSRPGSSEGKAAKLQLSPRKRKTSANSPGKLRSSAKVASPRKPGSPRRPGSPRKPGSPGKIRVKVSDSQDPNNTSRTPSAMNSPSKSNADYDNDRARCGVTPMPIYKPPSKQIQEEGEKDEPHQRLTITHLVLNDFKSYAGKQVIGPFDSSFSAVVGPNGSGKSNVIDSLLFVFGFRASKMRQSKVSSLIHNSTTHPNLSSCSVEVHFEDVIDQLDGTTMVVPDSKLVVSRKAFRNNSSKYHINDKESNFTEVTTLLKGRGIDLDHKRFLILQGEVESIAQMKAKADNEHDDGLLEYLEDIIGTADYKRIIDEAQDEVEQLNESCIEKTSRLEIVEKEKTGLSGRRNEIVKYLKLENQLVMKRSAFYQLNMSSNQNKVNVGEKMAVKLKEQLEQEEEKNNGIQEKIKELETEHADGIKEINGVKAKQKEIAKSLSIKERELVQLAERKKHLSSKRKKLEKTISSAQHSKREAENWLSNYGEETSRQQEKLQSLESSLKTEEAELENIRNTLRLKTQGFSDEIAKNQKLLDPWNAKIDQKRSEVSIAQSQVDILKEKDINAQQILTDSKRAIAEVLAQGKKREEEVMRLRKEYDHVSSQISLGTEECDHASKILKEMKNELSVVRQRASQAKESINAFKSQGKILSGLTRLRDSGRITGFHGRLGNLGTIDNKYDVAISTACPRLDNIVVDTVEVGQQCIEHLKKNNLGRGFFILLEKLPKHLNWDPIETPEGVPRLFDLIKLKDEIFAPAFYSVLNDTLVAKDLTQANRIAYGQKRWRVVTLDGQLIDKSGTMTGGGNQVARGGMKNKLTAEISDEAFSKLEEEREEQENKFSVASKTLQEMQAAMKTLQARKPQIELEVSKLTLEITSLSQSLKDAEAQHQEQLAEFEATKTSGDKEDMKKALGQVDILNAEVDALKAQTAGIQKVIADLQENILEAGGIKMRVQKSKVDGILQQIEIISNKLSDDSMAHSKSTSELKKYTKILSEAEAELSESAEENQAIEAEFNQSTLDVRKLEVEAEEISNILIDKEEAILAIKTALDEQIAAVNEARSAEIELRNQLQENMKAIQDSMYNYEKWKGRYQALSLHDINLMCGKEREEGEEAPSLPEFSEDEISTFNRDNLKRSITSLEKETLNANIDVSILTEYARREKEYETRRLGLNEAVELRDQTKLKVDTLKRRRLEEFMVGFNKITMKLKEMYQMITMGGNAELELVDSLDPFAEGILFSVMPPKKSWRNISNLSGGEKTLSSLALVFALHHYKPTPLYVMDEIDAALDFRNVSIVASYIKERTKNAQFIVISLRNNMFELSKQLVGIYKVNNMTKSIALQNKDIVHDRKPIIKLEQKSDLPESKLPQITEEIIDNNTADILELSESRRSSLKVAEIRDGVPANKPAEIEI